MTDIQRTENGFRLLRTEQPADSVELLRGDTITPETIKWLWDGWLANGKLHLLAGPPGAGKTTLALKLLAELTRGGKWPDGTRAPVGSVLVWSGEDGIADTLLPRFMAAGGDVARIHFVSGVTEKGESRPFEPATDMPKLAQAVEQIGDVKLLLLDPVVSAVAGDSHKNTEVRRSLQPVVDLARDADLSVLGISHLSKSASNGGDPVQSILGSVAFVAVARVVLIASKTKDQDGNPTRVFVRGKSNIGPDDGGFEYEILNADKDAHFASFVEFGDAVEGTARELLAAGQSDDEAPTSDKSTSASDILLQELSTGKMIASAELEKTLKSMGYSSKQFRTAREKIGVKFKKDGKTGQWFTYLPHGHEGYKTTEQDAQNEQDAQDAQESNPGKLGKLPQNGQVGPKTGGYSEVF